jgi:glycine cleavage system H protein
MVAKLKFTKTHEWIKAEGEEFIVGITEHAQQLLGDMVFVDLPEEGDEVNAGEEVAVVESVKAASDVYSPVSGVIVAVNQAVSEEPSLVNKDPYEAGWLLKIKPHNIAELDELLEAEEYNQEIKEDH